jgi:hypothetical protein
MRERVIDGDTARGRLRRLLLEQGRGDEVYIDQVIMFAGQGCPTRALAAIEHPENRGVRLMAKLPHYGIRK